MATWTIDDATLGAFAGDVFTTGTQNGGTSMVHATWNGLTGSATIHVKLHASVMTTGCKTCPTFPAAGTMSCNAMAQDPQLVYPPDGILVPPNMNVLQVQFQPGTANTVWEIDFSNAATDVRVETLCNAISDAQGVATGGCSYDLDPQVWAYIAQSNRGGDPLTITVRGWDGKAACVSGSNSRAMSFATEDLNAGLYYWQSVVIGGVQGKTGGIYRYDFGKQGQTGDPYLVPTQTVTTCIGCHFLSRDGVKMSFGADDADADDEYSDLKASLLDVATKAVAPMSAGKISPGFQTFSHDHALLLASDGKAMNNPAAFFELDGTTGAPIRNVPTATKRATHPDWSFDDTFVAYVAPQTFFCNTGMACANGNDEHFSGGSLYTMPFDTTAKTFGTPVLLLTSAGENNYYPAIAPDGKLIAFDRAPASQTGLAADAFTNIAARVNFLTLTKQGAAPVDGTAANLGDGLTNSWPRWSPFVHMYKGKRIAWITFSSTRDYGLRVRNSVMVGGVSQVNCFPPESPQNPMGSKMMPLAPNCHQPQLWMTAVDLDKGESAAGDPSWPAFWLPFQDPQAHNHIAQWVEKIVGVPPPDGGVDMSSSDLAGACLPLYSACADGGEPCCVGQCISGSCDIPIM
jgi:hypothetical protein